MGSARSLTTPPSEVPFRESSPPPDPCGHSGCWPDQFPDVPPGPPRAAAGKHNKPVPRADRMRYSRNPAQGDPVNASGFSVQHSTSTAEFCTTHCALNVRTQPKDSETDSKPPPGEHFPFVAGMVWRTALSPTQGRRPAHCASYNSHLGINA